MAEGDKILPYIPKTNKRGKKDNWKLAMEWGRNMGSGHLETTEITRSKWYLLSTTPEILQLTGQKGEPKLPGIS